MPGTYQSTRNVRRDSRTLVGRFRGGKLAPVAAVPVKGNEGGLLSQSVTLELDPIAGRLITPITAEMIAVFVPVQAMDAIKDPDGDFAGLTEVIREKLLSGNPLFGLENEHEISKRCGINPRSIDGQKKVNEAVRLAHNAAVNYLRVRKYVNATKLLANNTAITPALISQTVLDRFNAVLDPDDRINGMVNLEIPEMRLPVVSETRSNVTSNSYFPAAYQKTHPNAGGVEGAVEVPLADGHRGAQSMKFENASTGAPTIFAELNGAEAGGVSLVDFYNAEKMDSLVRRMRSIVDANPEYGEEMVLRWAHGLSVDTGKIPFVIHQQRQIFGRSIAPAMDTVGVEEKIIRSDMLQQLSFTVPIPKTELGGIVITFASIKPDETISSQPDPFLSEPWGVENFVADELALDPVPVTIRELDSDCDQVDENTVAMYTGLNQMKALYIHYGLTRQVNPTTLDEKTVVWQLEVPLSVTPDTILYPDTLPHTPFADTLAEVCTYTLSSSAVLQTPMIIGPTPVEELAILNENDLFEQESE